MKCKYYHYPPFILITGMLCFSVFDKCVDCLDNLRSVKSTVEGSDINITAPEVNESCLLELKQLTLMHIPSSITDEARQKFQDLVHKLFEGTGYCANVNPKSTENVKRLNLQTAQI